MALKYAKGRFNIKNPEKYSGKKVPIYRSSWEMNFMIYLDNNPHVLSWASEAIHIPYINPFTNKKTIYVPDFIMVYMDKSGQRHAEVIEIKPKKEVSIQAAGKSQIAQARAVLNSFKWKAAEIWCRSQGMKFRVLTEDHLFR